VKEEYPRFLLIFRRVFVLICFNLPISIPLRKLERQQQGLIKKDLLLLQSARVQDICGLQQAARMQSAGRELKRTQMSFQTRNGEQKTTR
jgi:hypothetical protein